GRALPFVANPVIDRKWMRPLFEQGLLDIDQPLDPCQQVDLTLSVAHLLQRHAGTSTRLRTPLALDRLVRVRELIAADPSVPRPLGELERVAGLDRWTLARQFRAAFGTSPSHFRTMRQLDRARTLVRAGATLADAAAEAGFADQSHFTRLFKRAYGLTPASWRRAIGQ
ncbi:AraC family transcriptional regulator, partial [uncultured Pigmentiphaga sp.]